jgi:hypothetical protein
MLGVFGAGRILNAKTARSQVIGDIIWGLSGALHEEGLIDERYVRFVNDDLAGYHFPAHADVVNVDAVLLPEVDHKSHPLKSKGLGELGICGARAAIANAGVGRPRWSAGACSRDPGAAQDTRRRSPIANEQTLCMKPCAGVLLRPASARSLASSDELIGNVVQVIAYDLRLRTDS